MKPIKSYNNLTLSIDVIYFLKSFIDAMQFTS